MSLPIKAILVASVFRSGQTWLCCLLSATTKFFFIEPYCFLRGINHSLDPLVNKFCWSQKKPLEGVVIKTHEYPDPYLEDDIKVILIYRNPLETIISELTRRKIIIMNGTDYDSLEDQSIEIKKTFNLRRFILFKFRFLLIVLLSLKWNFYYKKWLFISKKKNFKIINYDNLNNKTIQTIDIILNDYLNYNINKETIESSVKRFSKKNMQKNALENKIQPIFVSQNYKVKINFIEKYFIKLITNHMYKKLVLNTN